MARVVLLLTSGVAWVGLLGIGLAHASPSLDACLAECKRSQLSATNRASCRLDCENDAASDPEQVRAQMAQQAPARSPATPPPARGAQTLNACNAACNADRSLSVDDRASCKLDCEQEALPDPGAPPSAANAPVAPTLSTPTSAPAPASPGFLARCQANCRTRPAASQASCEFDCGMMASVLHVFQAWLLDAWLTAPPSPPVATLLATTSAPPAVPPRTPHRPPASATGQGCGAALEACNTSCERHESNCGRSCGRSHRLETDRETCRLTCGTEREVCQGDCLSANAACINGQARR